MKVYIKMDNGQNEQLQRLFWENKVNSKENCNIRNTIFDPKGWLLIIGYFYSQFYVIFIKLGSFDHFKGPTKGQ